MALDERATKAQNTLRLYRKMPDAPPVPIRDGQELWGDIEGNSHWEFCAAIIDMMANIARAYSR